MNVTQGMSKDFIEEQSGHLYNECEGSDTTHLRTIIAEKPWIGFDLDDTLHEFRRSSSAATNKVLNEISNQYGITIPELKEQYARVLGAKTSNAFSDGKTSWYYRRERFAALMEHFELLLNEQFMEKLLDLYEKTLMASLELKEGAIDLLSTLKGMGKKIVIITEGPQDAQERTIEGLGIGKFVDFLATSNYFGVSKMEGLFPRVLEHLGILREDLVYVGDCEERDTKPAVEEGIFAVLFGEGSGVDLDGVPLRIDSLSKLRYLFEVDV